MAEDVPAETVLPLPVVEIVTPEITSEIIPEILDTETESVPPENFSTSIPETSTTTEDVFLEEIVSTTGTTTENILPKGMMNE